MGEVRWLGRRQRGEAPYHGGDRPGEKPSREIDLGDAYLAFAIETAATREPAISKFRLRSVRFIFTFPPPASRLAPSRVI